MDERIYEIIAKQYGVSVESVKKDMQEAIDVAFENKDGLVKNIPCKGNKPTIDEFMDFVKNMLIS